MHGNNEKNNFSFLLIIKYLYSKYWIVAKKNKLLLGYQN